MKILFVCIENSCRSQMAEAFARLHGGSHMEAYSAGSKPSGKINPQAILSMKELDYDLSKHVSRSLAEIPKIDYDYAVTMGCGDECPLVHAKHRVAWDIPDPKEMSLENFRAVRNLIETKVKELLS